VPARPSPAQTGLPAHPQAGTPPHADKGVPPPAQAGGPPPAEASGPTSAENGPAQRPAAVSQYTERFAALLAEMGVPRMPARTFAALVTTDTGRLTAAEIGELLQASPGAVSGAVRYLIQVGLVARASEPGSRRLTYSVPDNVWQHLVQVRNASMSRWASMMRDGEDVLGDSPAGQRMAQSARFFEFVAQLLPELLARWDQYQAEADDRT
jgi:DNA-binding transcriptional regulator GbsR (MarR family)